MKENIDRPRRQRDKQRKRDADRYRHQHQRAKRLPFSLAILSERQHASSRRRNAKLKKQTGHDDDSQAERESPHLRRLHPSRLDDACAEARKHRRRLRGEKHPGLAGRLLA